METEIGMALDLFLDGWLSLGLMNHARVDVTYVSIGVLFRVLIARSIAIICIAEREDIVLPLSVVKIKITWVSRLGKGGTHNVNVCAHLQCNAALRYQGRGL